MSNIPARCRYQALEAARGQPLEDSEAPPPMARGKLTPEQQLQEHQAQRPEMPRPFVVDSPEAIVWHAAFAKWAAVKDRLQARLAARTVAHEVKRAPRQGMTGPWGGAK